jgi:hypothetical protein
LARRHFRSRLCRKPQDRDRGHDRCRPGRLLRARDHGRARLMEGQCRRALAGRRPQQPRPFERATGWPKNPRELRRPTASRAGRSCGHWAQTLLSAREGRAGSRIIKIRATQETTVSTVSSVCDQPALQPARDVCDDNSRSDLVGRYPMGSACAITADDADGADGLRCCRPGCSVHAMTIARARRRHP